MAADGSTVAMKSTQVAPLPLSKDLYENPPQSSFFLIQIIYNYIHFIFCTMSKIPPGQWTFSLFDYFIVKLQKTLEFCVPIENESKVKKERSVFSDDVPMNWIFFIPLLIVLRVLRFYMSMFSIIMGKGEVTAEQMMNQVVHFRQYYRSVRHYAILSYSPLELLLKESRTSQSSKWQIAYHIYEVLFVTTPPHDETDVPPPQQTTIPTLPPKEPTE